MIRLGEPVFRSIQGEGNRTGALSIWVRLFGCNLNCSGFMQDDPTDPSTYKLPQFDGREWQSIKEIPVFERGCDSGYSWNAQYKNLTIDYKTAQDLVDDIQKLTYNGSWVHPVTNNMIDICFTGGEPMMQQGKIIEVMNIMNTGYSVEDQFEGAAPCYIQIETNGTKPLKEEFVDYFSRDSNSGLARQLICFNISPKLWNVSGERKALKADIVNSYIDIADTGCLKFVMNNDDRAWDELNEFVRKLDYNHLPIYIMPVGATKEQQEDSVVIREIANRAIDNGYHVSGRLHCNIWGNGIGT